jgi:hypothetical protein
MNHTPGPWTIRPSRLTEGAHYVEGGETASKWLVAEVSGQGERNASNARLISAAPDLLEVAQDYLAFLYDHLHSSYSQEEFDARPEVVFVRNAIKKATGE